MINIAKTYWKHIIQNHVYLQTAEYCILVQLDLSFGVYPFYYIRSIFVLYLPYPVSIPSISLLYPSISVLYPFYISSISFLSFVQCAYIALPLPVQQKLFRM